MKQLKNEQGFTLTEMMIVIAIIGVLLVLILPNAIGALTTAKTKGCEAYVKTVESQAQLYKLDHPDETLSIAALQTAGYITAETCPDGKTLTIDANGNVSAN